jgi:hypothetical protein
VDGIQDIRDHLPTISPNLMLPFARWGINPFEDRFEVTLHNDGTIRGTGGVRVVRDDCATSVPGLYVAGDVATRELVAGATLRRRRPELRVGIVLGALGRPRRGQLRPQPRSTFRTPHTDWRSWIATAWHRLRERYARHGPGRQGRRTAKPVSCANSTANSMHCMWHPIATFRPSSMQRRSSPQACSVNFGPTPDGMNGTGSIQMSTG